MAMTFKTAVGWFAWMNIISIDASLTSRSS